MFYLGYPNIKKLNVMLKNIDYKGRMWLFSLFGPIAFLCKAIFGLQPHHIFFAKSLPRCMCVVDMGVAHTSYLIWNILYDAKTWYIHLHQYSLGLFLLPLSNLILLYAFVLNNNKYIDYNIKYIIHKEVIWLLSVIQFSKHNTEGLT